MVFLAVPWSISPSASSDATQDIVYSGALCHRPDTVILGVDIGFLGYCPCPQESETNGVIGWQSINKKANTTLIFISFVSNPPFCLLLPPSCFSRVQPCVTPIDSSPPGSSVAGILQARILEWVAVSFCYVCMHAKSFQSCPTLCNLMDSSPPSSSVHRVLQAKILEWVAISFSSFLSGSLLFRNYIMV